MQAARRKISVALLPLALVCAGCAIDHVGHNHKHPVAAPGEPAREHKVERLVRVPLLNSPRRVREDYAYPSPYTRSNFDWTGKGGVWHLRFTPRRYGYAGYVFDKAIDLSNRSPESMIKFRVKPAHMARYVSLALIDGNARSPRVMVDVPMADEESVREDADWPEIRILLSAFPARGLALETDDPSRTHLFDWSDVAEMRIIAETRGMPNQEILVSQIFVFP